MSLLWVTIAFVAAQYAFLMKMVLLPMCETMPWIASCTLAIVHVLGVLLVQSLYNTCFVDPGIVPWDTRSHENSCFEVGSPLEAVRPLIPHLNDDRGPSGALKTLRRVWIGIPRGQHLIVSVKQKYDEA